MVRKINQLWLISEQAEVMFWPFHCLNTISFPIRIKATISGRFGLGVKRHSRLSAQARDLTGEGWVCSGATRLIRGLEGSQVASPLPSIPARAEIGQRG